MKSLHININEPEENSIALKLPMVSDCLYCNAKKFHGEEPKLCFCEGQNMCCVSSDAT